ncbi:hypothetical protein FOZ60_010040 [Perkinsus olseni]|uniref:Uncharacterized protein n=1 Tax=Perkinsus olseni TaxID=32597 RepID=A0A7J6NHA8_PEROL|nr:hypothetical protein FOZ60_010040 [Perkinsus olseni]
MLGAQATIYSMRERVPLAGVWDSQTYTGDPQTGSQRFPDGVNSTASTILDVSDMTRACPGGTGPEAISILRTPQINAEDFAGTCSCSAMNPLPIRRFQGLTRKLRSL